MTRAIPAARMGAARGGLDRLSRAIRSCGRTISSRRARKWSPLPARSMPMAGASGCCWSRPMTEAAERGTGDGGGRRHQVIVEPFGDIWLRDTGPIILGDRRRAARAISRFNGWGGKYDLPGDDDIGAAARGTAAHPTRSAATGSSRAARSTSTAPASSSRPSNACSIPIAIPACRRAEIEARLRDDLGFERILWLGDGLLQRSYRRPCRQSRPLRRRPDGWPSPSRGRRRSQLAASISDAARAPRPLRAWRSSASPRPAGCCATARSCRRAT